MMKRVIVTGAAGFLGSHLAKLHLDLGDQVLGVDDFCSSLSTSLHHRDLLAYENYTFVRSDICDPTLPSRLTWMMPHIIYNFACPASPPRYQAMPVHTMMTCVLGTNHLLQVAQLTGAVMVHASTSEVYGDPDISPQLESYRGCVNSYGPRACYDEGKRAAEALCYDYLNIHRVDARMVRIFNTYGPNMDPYDGRVVSNFIVQAIKGEPLTIYGHGQQTRSFCYVDDLVRGIVALGALPENPLTPINVGNPTEFTISRLAELVAQKLKGGRLDAKPMAMPKDDPTQRRPDITFARDLLGWEPKVDLNEGLDRTIAYFKTVIV
jgi:UDP-glucuronate decarboxylase